jgi:Xaa-Pro aminopeptidase
MTEVENQAGVSAAPAHKVDLGRLHRERVARAQQSLRDRGIAAALLFNPLNVRYVSYPGLSIVATFHMTFRWALLPAEGKVLLWDSFPAGGDPHLFAAGNGADPKGREVTSGVPEYFTGTVRLAHGFSYFPCGSAAPVSVRSFTAEIVDVLKERGLLGERIAIDRLDGSAFVALSGAGVQICDGQTPLEHARSVKTVDELGILRDNARNAARGLDALQERLRPGVTENQLWGTFMGSAMSNGAEWGQTRMLSSGQRTNPWMQEATDRVVQVGELVGIDTDLCGRNGYMTDVSRTYLCGDGKATDQQRRLYHDAYEFVHGNIPDIRAGASYKELGERLGARFPKQYYDQRYVLLAHGVGVCDEFPAITWDNNHEGALQAGMVISVEAYCGVVGGTEGVKVEEQVIVTDDGPEIITGCANHDEHLLA